MTTRASLRSAAHEASHGVVAVLLGVPVQEVTLRHCIAAEPDLDKWPVDSRFVKASAKIALAGCAADQIMFAGEQYDEQAYSEAMAHSDDLGAADKMVAAMGLTVDENLDAPTMMLERLAGQTRDLVVKNWHLVALVASELLRKGTLSGAEVKTIVRSGRPLAQVDWSATFAEISASFTGVA